MRLDQASIDVDFDVLSVHDVAHEGPIPRLAQLDVKCLLGVGVSGWLNRHTENKAVRGEIDGMVSLCQVVAAPEDIRVVGVPTEIRKDPRVPAVLVRRDSLVEASEDVFSLLDALQGLDGSWQPCRCLLLQIPVLQEEKQFVDPENEKKEKEHRQEAEEANATGTPCGGELFVFGFE